MPTKLNEVTVSLGQLMLDPNNPRFVEETVIAAIVPDEQVVKKATQDALLKRFTSPSSDSAGEDDKLDTISVEDLRESMLRIGYVGIDKIVVRQIKDTDKFLVLEGNRRVAALKTLQRDHEAGTNAKKLSDYEKHKASYENLRVLELATSGLSVAEVQRAVSVILGIRHHGSLLPWDPLPRAFNIFCEFKKRPGSDLAVIAPAEKKAVAELLCISAGDVTDALKSYIVYLQLKEVVADIDNDDFSIIELAVTSKALASVYFKLDPNSYQLDNASLERLIRIGQFGRRSQLPKPGIKKTIANPPALRRLAKIVQARGRAHSDADRAFIDNILTRIEDEMDPLSVDDGLDEIIEYLAARSWRLALKELLEEKQKKLDEKDYMGTGNERGFREEAQRIIENLALIMKL